MSAYTGYLIRRTRLEKNLSQEGLARGICAVSYLSKIEQGLVEPGQDIIDRLFEALGIAFERAPQLEAEAQCQMDRFFFLIEANAPYEEQKAFFARHGERLLRSEFALYVRVFELISAAAAFERDRMKKLLAEIEPFLGCLDVRARRWVLLAKAELQEGHEDKWNVLSQAALLGENSVVTYMQASCAHAQGRYGLCMELAERAYSQAAYEGNVMTMTWSCFLLGTCACNRCDMEQAKRYYERVQALTRGSKLDMSSYMDYNLGSTYLETGDEESALLYLGRAGEQERDVLHNMLLHQKLAILSLKNGSREEGLEHLARAKLWFAQAELPKELRRTQLLEAMIRFAELMADECAASGSEFEQVTRMLYDEAEKQFSFGFKHFYGHFLMEIYKRQRRYKEALQVLENMEGM